MEEELPAAEGSSNTQFVHCVDTVGDSRAAVLVDRDGALWLDVISTASGERMTAVRIGDAVDLVDEAAFVCCGDTVVVVHDGLDGAICVQVHVENGAVLRRWFVPYRFASTIEWVSCLESGLIVLWSEWSPVGAFALKAAIAFDSGSISDPESIGSSSDQIGFCGGVVETPSHTAIVWTSPAEDGLRTVEGCLFPRLGGVGAMVRHRLEDAGLLRAAVVCASPDGGVCVFWIQDDEDGSGDAVVFGASMNEAGAGWRRHGTTVVRSADVRGITAAPSGDKIVVLVERGKDEDVVIPLICLVEPEGGASAIAVPATAGTCDWVDLVAGDRCAHLVWRPAAQPGVFTARLASGGWGPTVCLSDLGSAQVVAGRHGALVALAGGASPPQIVDLDVAARRPRGDGS